MIFDKVENLSQYFDKPWVGVVLDFYKTLDVNTPNGEYELMGRDLYCKVLDYETKTSDFITESHRKYVDIQIIMKGQEIIETFLIDKLNILVEYKNEIDCTFYENSNIEPLTRVLLEPSFFALFFPQDAHKTQIALNNVSNSLKKIVFKVEKSLFNFPN
jgi:biofilm protein TabA